VRGVNFYCFKRRFRDFVRAVGASMSFGVHFLYFLDALA
jgi:hypothetical protein